MGSFGGSRDRIHMIYEFKCRKFVFIFINFGLKINIFFSNECRQQTHNSIRRTSDFVTNRYHKYFHIMLQLQILWNIYTYHYFKTMDFIRSFRHCCLIHLKKHISYILFYRLKSIILRRDPSHTKSLRNSFGFFLKCIFTATWWKCFLSTNEKHPRKHFLLYQTYCTKCITNILHKSECA